MTLYKKMTALILFSLSVHGFVHAKNLHDAHLPVEGKEYISLSHAVSAQPAVVEFFSFYCGPCYQFVENYPVASAINTLLPEGKTVAKYHVSSMGPLGNELTEAWAIAMVMGKTNTIEKPLFEAIRNKKLMGVADIQTIFSKAGIDAATYEHTRHSQLVKGVIAKQNTAMEAFAVRSTPSFYVNGKYQINNAGIAGPTPEDYVNGFAQTVKTLLAE